MVVPSAQTDSVSVISDAKPNIINMLILTSLILVPYFQKAKAARATINARPMRAPIVAPIMAPTFDPGSGFTGGGSPAATT